LQNIYSVSACVIPPKHRQILDRDNSLTYMAERIVSKQSLSIKFEEKSFTPTTPLPPVQGGRSPIIHWHKGQGSIPDKKSKEVRGDI
jgi:hypothetical protein